MNTGMNFAADSAHVDVQATVVHGGIHYTVSPGSSPQEKFEAGVRNLESDMAGRARQLIDEAVVSRYITNQVCFYWLLAMLSGRTRHELSEEETARLRDSERFLPLTGDDSWAHGVRIIRRLLESAGKSDADIRVLAGPRVREPTPVAITGSTWAQAVTGTVVSVAAAAHIGYLLLQNGQVPSLLAYLLSVVGGYFGARDGVEWRFRSGRRRAKDLEYAMATHRRITAPPGGFAWKVDQRFDYYFAKYVPRGADREVWLTRTAGIRRSMRDEVVDVYRETRIPVEKINWLIRHRVGDVRKRWENGTLWNYRQELGTPWRAKGTAVLGALAFAAGGVWAASGAVQADPWSAIRSVALVVAAGWIAAHAWLRIILERRRHAADESERAELLADGHAASARWRERLADKPEDREMAAWLDYDRKVLLNLALEHYRLKMSEIIAYAFIETPSRSTDRARLQGGPWRYRKYRLLTFLITADGVRQLTVRLDFEDGTFHDRHRMNYRFEAVAAVHVTHADDDERTFELALVDGQKISVKVIEPGTEELQQGEDPGTVSEATLDAAGLHHTLHVLEGIAAEGKAWMNRGDARSEKRWPPPQDEEPGP
ncbi:hypothetical protein [Planotetraspora sp. GP83]|uniref:hypothetical protein n=1 Tax=Planotetraspora sp. GP83 TaxID=3156264 RepID=UPI00351761DA